MAAILDFFYVEILLFLQGILRYSHGKFGA